MCKYCEFVLASPSRTLHVLFLTDFVRTLALSVQGIILGLELVESPVSKILKVNVILVLHPRTCILTIVNYVSCQYALLLYIRSFSVIVIKNNNTNCTINLAIKSIYLFIDFIQSRSGYYRNEFTNIDTWTL